MIKSSKKCLFCLTLLSASVLVSMATVGFLRLFPDSLSSPLFANGGVISASGLILRRGLRVQPLSPADGHEKTRLVSHLQDFVPGSNTVKAQGPSKKSYVLAWRMKDINRLIDRSEPMPNMTLHFVWCGSNRFLDYRHYLSIKSAIAVIQPAQIMFHYQYLPMEDPQGYFTWFEQLRSEYSNMALLQISRRQNLYSNSFSQYAYVFKVLSQHGGIFVPEDSLVLKIPSRIHNMSFVSGIWSCNQQVFVAGMAMARKGQFEVPPTEMHQVRNLSVCPPETGGSGGLHPCTTISNYLNSGGGTPSCVRLSSPLYPRDLWVSRDQLAIVGKVVAYNRTEIHPRHSESANERAPRVAHYLCDRNCSVSFTFFLSILSALHVGGLDHVMIHGPTAPSGQWWERLQQQRANVVHFVHRDNSRQESLHQNSTNETRRHIARTEILLQQGGVFHDSHVIWTQALPEDLLGYETVVSPDWRQYGGWPESVNHALIVARRNATYLERLLHMYRKEADRALPWLADRFLSYRLIELDPTLVFLHPQLQVQCIDKICHPSWEANDFSLLLQNMLGRRFDWRKDTLSVHWDPGTAPDLNVERVLFSSEIITEIAEHVLASAGEDINYYV